MTPSKTNIKSNLKAFDAVESIFNQIAKEKDTPVVAGTPVARTADIRNVSVPNELIESVVNFAVKKKVIEKPESIEEVQPEPKKETITEEVVVQNKLGDLVQRLSALLKEAKDFLNEMTTTGMIGTNQKFSLFKKKNGSNKTNKRNKG